MSVGSVANLELLKQKESAIDRTRARTHRWCQRENPPNPTRVSCSFQCCRQRQQAKHDGNQINRQQRQAMCQRAKSRDCDDERWYPETRTRSRMFATPPIEIEKKKSTRTRTFHAPRHLAITKTIHDNIATAFASCCHALS